MNTLFEKIIGVCYFISAPKSKCSLILFVDVKLHALMIVEHAQIYIYMHMYIYIHTTTEEDHRCGRKFWSSGLIIFSSY